MTQTSALPSTEAPKLKRVLRFRAVMDATGEGRSTIYEKIAKGEFPRPIRLGPQSVGFLEDEVIAYQQKKIAERDAEAA